jgi:DNA-binding protein YbaB
VPVGSRDADPDVLAELRAARRAILARLETLDQLAQEAAERLFYGESATGAAVATVDGNGRLLELWVDPEAVRGAHPEAVGPQIVAAVTAGRSAARADRAHRIRQTDQPDGQ